MSAGKPYEKEKDILLKEIRLEEPYLILTGTDNSGWPIFVGLKDLSTEQKEERIQAALEAKTFAGLVEFKELPIPKKLCHKCKHNTEGEVIEVDGEEIILFNCDLKPYRFTQDYNATCKDFEKEES